jgi:hypothetical protein
MTDEDTRVLLDLVKFEIPKHLVLEVPKIVDSVEGCQPHHLMDFPEAQPQEEESNINLEEICPKSLRRKMFKEIVLDTVGHRLKGGRTEGGCTKIPARRGRPPCLQEQQHTHELLNEGSQGQVPSTNLHSGLPSCLPTTEGNISELPHGSYSLHDKKAILPTPAMSLSRTQSGLKRTRSNGNIAVVSCGDKKADANKIQMSNSADYDMRRDFSDAPTFDLGLDDDVHKKGKGPQQVNEVSINVIGAENDEQVLIDNWDDNWDPAEVERIVSEAEDLYRKRKVEAQKVGQGCSTTTKRSEPETPINIASGSAERSEPASPINIASGSAKRSEPASPINIASGSGAMQQAQKIVKLPACQASPFVDYKSKTTFACSRDVTEAYDAILKLGRGTSRNRGEDNRSELD